MVLNLARINDLLANRGSSLLVAMEYQRPMKGALENQWQHAGQGIKQ
jgi:hypothetical protein